MKVFVILVDVLGEDSIIKWYNNGHTTKGKSVFLPQMQKMVDWLQNAEEGIAHLCTYGRITMNPVSTPSPTVECNECYTPIVKILLRNHRVCHLSWQIHCSLCTRFFYKKIIILPQPQFS